MVSTKYAKPAYGIEVKSFVSLSVALKSFSLASLPYVKPVRGKCNL